MANVERYTPTFGSLRREIDRLFDTMLSDGNGGGSEGLWSPKIDVTETGDHYMVRLDVPGLSREDLNIELVGDALTISGQRRHEHEDSNETVHRIERSFGRFYRSLSLPQSADPEGVEAKLENGVLLVRVRKTEESKPRRIEVS